MECNYVWLICVFVFIQFLQAAVYNNRENRISYNRINELRVVTCNIKPCSRHIH